MDLLAELTKRNPADHVTISWQGDTVDAVSVKPEWEESISLGGLLKHVVEEVNARRGADPLSPVELKVKERGLTGGEIARLGPLLARYNAARSAAREQQVSPSERITTHGRVNLLWYGETLTGIRIDPEWAMAASAQGLSDALSAALSELPPAPCAPEELTQARDDLVGFLG